MSNAVQTETIVTLTEKAAAQIKSMQADQAENQGKPLRIYVEEGGCSGLQYGMTFDERRDGGQDQQELAVERLLEGECRSLEMGGDGARHADLLLPE